MILMLSLEQILVSAIIGVVQGISEWLPISSKTQVLVASQYLLGLSFSQAYTFGLFMEVGTILAAVIYFRREVRSLIMVLLGKGGSDQKSLFTYVFIATLATFIIGVPIYLFADSLQFVSVGIPMLIIGAVLLADALIIRHSKKMKARNPTEKTFKDLGLKDYALIGVAQGLAALPGVSRSGITTSTMLLMKVEPDEAFRLSFLIGIFASLGAFGLTVIVSKSKILSALSAMSIYGVLIAIAVATVISLFLIDFLIKIAGKSKIVYVTAGLGIIAIAGGVLYLLTGI